MRAAPAPAVSSGGDDRVPVVVAGATWSDLDVARALARQLALPLLESTPAPNALVLESAAGGLQLRDAARPRERPWRVDFSAPRASYRRLRGGGVRQTLARAAGLAGGVRPAVLDLTAGWGADAFVLAALGCAVTLVERHPVVAALLGDGLARAAAAPATAAIAARMRLHRCTAQSFLARLAPEAAPEVVYLDPMYPPSGKSAASRKELRLLRRLAGPAGEEPELLRSARAATRGRVVVKRPRRAAPYGDCRPDSHVESANTRYDIYFSDASHESQR